MILYAQTLLAAVQFDGLTAATGLLDFTASYSFVGLPTDVVPVIYSISYDGRVTTTGTFQASLIRPGGPATMQSRIADLDNLLSFDTACAKGRAVQREGTSAAPVIWNLVLLTLAKAADASVNVLWRPELRTV